MNSRKLKAHHPNISFGWGNATVSLQTKKIKGLHESYQEVPSAKLMCIEARSETLKLRRIWRLVFHALARGIIAGALGDTQTPAIPKKIIEGAPEIVRRAPEVVEAYLGHTTIQ